MIGWVIPGNGKWIYPVLCWIEEGDIAVVKQGWYIRRHKVTCIDTEAELVALLFQGYHIAKQNPTSPQSIETIRGRHVGTLRGNRL